MQNVSPALARAVGIEPHEELPSYAWPGGYPLYYLDGDNCVLCPKCANASRDGSWDDSCFPVAYSVNWEDTDLYCEQCSKHIESAYGDDESEGK